ncbi:MFS transporter [Streptoalloteichus hindustanus]|uniref:Predicted arabinose efflux permease, MFS family n=1 Tax=Streptoalloteichus hindustanus TaxID=2017 RepID=A0A1M5CH72_STRHI|nr:MFS transporter [Streptoalloteichus hindustanus]SHF54079.1 Predicted arabinose efflux permease, MFS family [Streptoalloteichus hindustanus]
MGKPQLLAGLALSQLLVALDFSIIYVALPTIGSELSFSPVTLQWIVSAYAIFFAGFLLLGGRLVDVFGAGRVFLVAQAVFTGAAVAAGFAPNAEMLMVCRAAQGVGAALLNPAMLGLLHANYPSGRARDRAVAVWGTTGAMGLALGVVVGGLLLAVASWPWIFWINLPVAVISVLATAGAALRSRAARPGRRVDLPSATLVTAVVGGLSMAFTELAAPSPNTGVVVGSLAAVLVLAVLFVLVQRRREDRLIPADLLRIGSLRGACVIAALYMASMGAEFYLVTLFLQRELRMGVLAAGIGFLPLALTIAAGNALAGRLAGRWSLRRLLGVAFALGAAGLAMLAYGTSVEGYWAAVLPGLLVSGIGQGMAFTGMFVAGTRDLPSAAEGTGSAMITAAQYTGGAVGLALLVWVHGSDPTRSSLGTAYLATVVIAALALPVAGLLLPPRPTRS